MDHETYLNTIREATRGEILGEELFLQLANTFSGNERRKLLLLADLEAMTALMMERVTHRHGIQARSEDAGLYTENLLSLAKIESWRDFLDWMYDVTVRYVEIYENLALNAYPDDREELRFLANHEYALKVFLESEVRGEPNSEKHISEVLRVTLPSHKQRRN